MTGRATTLVPPRERSPELMDDRGRSTEELGQALRDIRWTNRWLGGRRVLLHALRPYLLEASPARPLRLLDVGTGGGDLPLAVAHEARRMGRRVRITALDANPRIVRIAATGLADCPQVRLVCGDALRLPFADRAFDVVTASMVLHHFAEDQTLQLLAAFCRVARRAVVINDLRRHRLPWAFIFALSRLTRRAPLYVHDAPLSVLRGFTDEELAGAARTVDVTAWRIRRRWPYRLVLTLDVGEGPA